VPWQVQVTHKVACLARWMAADLYLREVDVLRFELSQVHASDEVRVLHLLHQDSSDCILSRLVG
jgi:phosphoenolpyruvate carboxylase